MKNIAQELLFCIVPNCAPNDATAHCKTRVFFGTDNARNIDASCGANASRNKDAICGARALRTAQALRASQKTDAPKSVHSFNNACSFRAIPAAVTVCMLCAAMLFSCAPKTLPLTESERSAESSLHARAEDGTQTEEAFPVKKVAVFFGHGYNDKEFVADTLEYLYDCYGLPEGNDVIFPLVYPDDFKSGTRTRISLLDDKLLELHVSGVVLLGAPEDTNEALATLRDTGWLYPIYSFFPQDDVLGIEYVSDFVLENEDLNFQLDAESVFRLLRNTIDAIENTTAAKQQPDTQLKETVQSLIGKNREVHFYTDSETGIRSANHFLIKDNTPPPVGTIR